MTEVAAVRTNYTAADHALALLDDLNKWLSDVPAVTNEDAYREGARLAKLAGNCLADIDKDRKAELAPLHDEVGRINGRYKERTLPLRELLDILNERMTAFAVAEEKRRQAEAAAKRKAAEEEAERAREALERAAEAASEAEAGVVGVDMLATTQAAHEAAAAAGKAEREAARAERDTTFRVATGYGRATSMKSREELTLTDPIAALKAMGMTAKVTEAILSDARQWKRLKGDYPPGVVATKVRSL